MGLHGQRSDRGKVPRMTIRRWMIITAIAAVLCWATLNAPLYGPVAVMTAFGGLFGLGAMRHPWLFLAFAISLRVCLPTVYDSSAHDYFHGCYQIGWFMGAIAGMFVRMVRRRVGRRPEPVRSVAPS